MSVAAPLGQQVGSCQMLQMKCFVVAGMLFAAAIKLYLDHVNQVLKEGAARARAVATKVLQRAKVASGLD